MKESAISTSTDTAFALKATTLSVSRGANFLFSGLTFTLAPKELIWINGGNGIGKTTLLRLLAGYARPDSGEIVYELNGGQCLAKDIIGFQGHQDAFKPAHTAQEALSFWAELMELPNSTDTLLEEVGLAERKNVTFGTLSAGQKRRLALARLMLSQKKIWIMDEPTAAIDSDGVSLIYDLIETHIEQGGSAIIASHNPAQNIAAHTRRITLAVAS